MISDRLSPILVKELRQGLRARVFEGSFVLLQVMMVFVLVIALLAKARNESSVAQSFGQVIFWTMVGIPLLLIMPMRGCNSLRAEMDARSLELIFLTHLSAWRIVVGKWAALFCQTCLFVCAVLPYAVLRYYIGSIEIQQDLIVLGGLLLTSAVFTGLTVCTSAFNSKISRGMIFLFPFFLIIGLFGFRTFGILTRSFSGHYSPAGSMFSPVSGVLITGLGFLFYGGLALAYLLEIGAERISPVSENHAYRKRLIGILVLVASPVAMVLGVGTDILLLNFMLLLGVCIDATACAWIPVPGLLRPLRRMKYVLRPGVSFLLPGWPSGVLYSVVMMTASLAIMMYFDPKNDGAALLHVSALGTLLLPVAMILVVRPRMHRFGTAYYVLHLVLVILMACWIVIDQLFDLRMINVLSVLPQATLFLQMADEAKAGWILINIGVLILVVLAIAIRGIPFWAEMKQMTLRTTREPLG
jgi:hypothetical protein